MTRAIGVAILAWAWVGLGSVDATAKAGDTFTVRLSVVPVDARTTLTTSGTGSVRAVLIEDQLFLTGAFEGMGSAAIAAHIHLGRPGQRGPIAFQLSVSKNASGVLGGGVRLTDEEVQALRDGAYYIQVHTEGNPGGELRGWILEAE